MTRPRSEPRRKPPISSDTAPEIREVQVRLWREMSLLEKAAMVSGMTRAVRRLTLAGIRLRHPDAEPFVTALGGGFYVDVESLRRAIRRQSSTNLIHYASTMKIDVFVSGGSPLDSVQMDRRLRVQVASERDRWLHFYTPEDILLQKLRSYRLGNEVSDRQWRDVLGVVRVQAGRLDHDYLRDGARTLGVSDLLDRAQREADAESGRGKGCCGMPRVAGAPLAERRDSRPTP